MRTPPPATSRFAGDGSAGTGSAGTDAVGSLSREELLRYGRHLVLPQFGLEGQQKLKASSVLIVGAGGLGSPLALYLAAAGVGRIGLVDFDRVDVSNLQRQVLYGTSDIGRTKLEAARSRLADLNPCVAIETHAQALSRDNALEILSRYDVIADGTDNFPTRYLVNDACAMLGKPNVHGSIFRFEGQASVFDARVGPCYRCLYREPPPPGVVPSCAEGGVLGVLPGLIGTIQGIECIKLLTGLGEPLIGRLLVFDALGMRFRELTLKKDPDCPLCGRHPTIHELVDYESFCGLSPGEQAMVRAAAVEITARELSERMAGGEAPMLLDVREPHEHRIARIEGAVLIPLRSLPGRLAELDRERDIVVLCHRGARSLNALEILRLAGFARVSSLRGGIEAWSKEVDAKVPRY
jgi:adenylyltransferase/sulfurtransferase